MGKKRFAWGLFIGLICAATLAAGTGVASASTATDESQFVSKINHERSSRGLRTLSVRSDLVSAARKHSVAMANKGEIWHDPHTPYTVSGWTTYGENVGMGPDVDSLHTAFMNSKEHRDNILYPSFNQIGVGVVIGSDGTMYVTEIFVERGSAPKPVVHTVTKRTTQAPAPEPIKRVAAHVQAPKPAPVVAEPQTVELLVRLVGLGADEVDPATGDAAGL